MRRRSFLSSTGGALVLGAFCPGLAYASVRDGAPFRPNVFLEIAASGEVSLWLKKAEMGQHIHTALAVIAADELGIAPEALRLRQAPSEDRFGEISTGGSYAVPGAWLPLRSMMAQARAMLIRAAAERWRVRPDACRALEGRVLHPPSGRAARFGELAAAAAALDVPENAQLRPATELRYVGRSRPRLDVDEIVTGAACFGHDVRRPGMLFAAFLRAPMAGARIESLNETAARATAGFVQLLRLETKVAVVARDSWSAIRARDRLAATWRLPRTRFASMQDVWKDLNAALDGEGVPLRNAGVPPSSGISKRGRFEYRMPYAAHSAIEPPTATAQVKDGRVQVWAPIQMASHARREVSEALNVPESRVTIHTTLIGGSFGRKLERDFVLEAAEVARALGRPVQTVWTREEDMQFGMHRPISAHRVEAMLDERGVLAGCDLHSAAASVFQRDDPTQIREGFDWSMALGAVDFPYTVPWLSVRQSIVDLPAVATTWWRGTYRNHNCLAIECAVDELAHLAGADPLEFRCRHLREDVSVPTFPGVTSMVEAALLRRVLATAAAQSGWGSPLPAGHGRGIACHCYSDVGTYVAHVVQVAVHHGRLSVPRVWCAVDCGLAVNPDSVVAQMEGSVIFGLGAACYGEVPFVDGAVQGANFDRAPVLQLAQAPQVTVTIVKSDRPPAGIGETGQPSFAPALLNAIHAATGRRIRQLPLHEAFQVD